MKTINSAGLNQLVNEASRITSSSRTIIDLVFPNMDLDVKVRHEFKIADHSMLIWNMKEAKERSKRIICRDYKRMDVDEFKRLTE